MRSRPRALLASAALAGALAASPARAQLWGAGELFQTGVGGRALGMGGAQVAEAGEGTALYYNPAGLALLSAPQVELMHAALFDGAAMDYLGYAHGIGSRPAGWGAELLRLDSGSVPGADALNNPTGSYQYGEMAFAGGFGARFGPLLSLGAEGKYLTRTLPGSSDKFMAADLGAQYGPIFGDRVMLGAAAHNVFAVSSGDTTDHLPLGMRFGASWRPVKNLDIAAEVDQTMAPYIGAEYSLGLVALRAGYNPDGISFGGGINFRRMLSFDLAVVDSAALGLSQRVSLTYRFQSSKKAPRLNALSDTYLQNGIGELAARDYVGASRDIDIALGLDSNVGGGTWKRSGQRLRALVKDMNLEASLPDQEQLRQPGIAGDLASRAVGDLIKDDEAKGMLLAHVAAGTAGADSAQARLLKAAAKLTGQNIVREDLLASGAFVAERGRRAVEAVYVGRYDAAVRASEDALLISPEDPESWARLGSSHFAAGHRDEALKAYRKALELQPDDDKLRRFVKDKFGE